MLGLQVRFIKTISPSATGKNWVQLRIVITVIHFMKSDAGCGVNMESRKVPIDQLLSKQWVDWINAQLLYFQRVQVSK